MVYNDRWFDSLEWKLGGTPEAEEDRHGHSMCEILSS
jgi:hypothetical protein